MINKDYLLAYLRKIIPVTLTFLFSMLLLAMLWIFDQLDLSYLVLSIQIELFVWIIYLILASYHLKEDRVRRCDLKKSQQDMKALSERSLQERKELEDYFLLWMHQMKTPITAANLLLEMDSFSEQSQRLRIKSRLLEIDNYTNMALSYLKLGEQERNMDLVRIELKPLMSQILKHYSLLFIEHDDQVQMDLEDVWVTSDARWLSILLEQILSNAVKYTRSGTIYIYFDKKENSLCIKDTGEGIRSEDLPKIFDKGYSGFNGRLTRKSSGIGLFMVKKIAKRLSLEISVRSKVKEGSEFQIQFPT